MTRAVVGLAWYSRATWTALREVAPDGDALEATYEGWLQVFERGLAMVRASGAEAHRVEVGLDAFREWCALAGRPLDSAARAAFVSEQLRLRDGRPPSTDA